MSAFEYKCYIQDVIKKYNNIETLNNSNYKWKSVHSWTTWVINWFCLHVETNQCQFGNKEKTKCMKSDTFCPKCF